MIVDMIDTEDVVDLNRVKETNFEANNRYVKGG